MAEKNIEALASRLGDDAQDIKAKVAAASEMRDNVDAWCQTGHFSCFLEHFVPVCLRSLDGPIGFNTVSPDHRLRHCILETLHRLPMTNPDYLEPYATRIVDKLMSVVRDENEDNAILCIKIVMDFQRHMTKALADKVQLFLDFIQEMFHSTDHVVKETFEHSTASGIPAAAAATQLAPIPRPPSSPAVIPPDPGQDTKEDKGRGLIKGMLSFKVLAECPIAVVSIFQAYREVVAPNVKKFVPLIQDVLLAEPKAQMLAHAEAKANNTVHIGPAKDIKNKPAFAELVTAQVKTMSFLAYIMRAYGQQLQDFLPKVPMIIVRLLRDCPREKSGTRRELLVAIRHIINFNFRKVFLPQIDDLLDERTLLGDGLTVHESLKPLAFSAIADLIHHVREFLTLDQIRVTVRVYQRHLLSNVPGTSFQTMSAKILMNMAECIAKLEDKQEARYFLIAILDATGDKFAAMNRQYQNAVKISAQYDPRATEPSPDDYNPVKDHPPNWDEIDIFNAGPIKITSPRDRNSDPVTDNKFLFKNLVGGLKSVFYQLRTCNPPALLEIPNPPVNWQEVACGFSAEEVEVLIKLFHEGIKVFQYYECEKPPSESQLSPAELLASHQAVCNKEEKELLENFGTVFHHVDPATFHEVFHSEIPHIYEMMFEHPALLHVPQFLLASEATSPAFAGMLLQFLMGRIEDVGSSDVNRATILLRLFKLSFMAVTLFSQLNEQVLLPHVNKLVTDSIKLSTTAETPMHYFYLLRSLFRSIGGGRFEHLYKEILPLLEMLLEVLNNLIAAARTTQERDLYVELSLTVPARLSNLLPHLAYLMKPLVLALRAGSELVGQGLRTLELCVDNLTADYLDPIMAPVIDDLMTALWDHLQPSPYSHFHAHTTMRILGKLGGRNRKFLEGPPMLKFEQYSDVPPAFDVKFKGSAQKNRLPARLGIDLAISKLQSAAPKPAAAQASDFFQKQQALKLIITHIKLLIGNDSIPEDFERIVRLHANDFAEGRKSNVSERLMSSAKEESIQKRNEQQTTLKNLIKACMFATSVPDLAVEAKAFLADLYRHFTLLELAHAINEANFEEQPFNVDAGEGHLYVDHRALTTAIVDSFSSELQEVRDTAKDAVLSIRDAAAVLFGRKEPVTKLPFFTHIMITCCHSCYAEEWFAKSGGILGVKILASDLDLGHAWIVDRQLDICRALMYAAKDLPEDLPEVTRVSALDTLNVIIRKCNDDITAEEATQKHGKVHNLCSFLVLELAHTSKHVRNAAQKALSILAEISQMEVHQLVAPVKDGLLGHLFTKPLRALPFAIQIAYIDAVAYCLKLGNGILEANDFMSRFLQESLRLADQSIEEFPGRVPDQRHLENVTRLKVSCLRLLSLALDFPDNDSPSRARRPRIITVFFKLLYAKQLDVVDAANEALKAAVERDAKLPKDILQGGLRPILVSLQEPSKLKITNLNCLANLLQILKNYFKVEIGTRLLNNVKHVANAEVLQKASFKLVEQHDVIKAVAAIFNIFHLLPPAAHQFMDGFVNEVLDLEQQLRRTHFSPFREPLVKFLNRYPNETWERFQNKNFKLTDRAYGRLLAQIVSEEHSGPLRSTISQNIEPLVNALSNDDESETNQYVAIINVIHVTEMMCKFPDTRKTLLEAENFRSILLQSGKRLERQLRSGSLDPGLRIAAEQTGSRLMRIMTVYLSENIEDLDCLFQIIRSITANELRETPALFQLIYEHIVCSNSSDFARNVITRCVDIYASRTNSEKMKAFVIHNIINTLLAKDIMRNWDTHFGTGKGTKLVNKSLVDMIRIKFWQELDIYPLEEDAPLGIDISRIELLQTTAILLKHYSVLTSDSRKDIIHFGWTYIRLEDVMIKHASYVVLAYFIATFYTPPKVASQVYSTLITAHVTEARSLIVQALEVLAPVLQERMGGEDSKVLVWARLARKPIMDDPSNIQQMLSIFQFIARHPDLFYETKQGFSQIIISNIHKVATLPAHSVDVKRTALSLINLIWTWEQKYASEQGSNAGGDSPSNKRNADGTLKLRSFITSEGTRNILIKYLVQFIACLQDRFPTPSFRLHDLSHPLPPAITQSAELCKRAVILFSKLLSPPFWSDLDISAMFPKVTEHILTLDPKQEDRANSITRIINTLQLLNVMVNIEPDEWVVDRLPQLQRLLEKPIRNGQPEVQDCLFAANDDADLKQKPLMKRILEVIPEEGAEEELPDADAPSPSFLSFLNTVVNDTLLASNHLAAINILATFAQCRPNAIDQHIPNAMKVLNNYAKEYLSSPASTSTISAASYGSRQSDTHMVPPDSPQTEMQVQMILKMIDILAIRIVQLGDHRRPFLSVLTTLIEKSPNSAICLKILDLVSEWVFVSTEMFPTLKEKNAVILKMMTFEAPGKNPQLFDKFLELVIRIYEDEKITRSELAIRLEPAFLIGTRARNIKMRNRFMNLFDRHLTRTATKRFLYLLASQNWDSLADTFWLSQTIQLLMGSVEMDAPASLAPEDFRTKSFTKAFQNYSGVVDDIILDDEYEQLIQKGRQFCKQLGEVRAGHILEPLCNLQHSDSTVASELWIALFPILWSLLSKDEQKELQIGMITMMTREFHIRSIDQRPNCVQALLEGVARTENPRMNFPHNLTKFLARTHDGWYIAMSSMEQSAISPIINTVATKESNLDALAEVYADLQEDDLFYGLWRRRSQFLTTNTALSYEQIGNWDRAQRTLESATFKARTGELPFSQSEYMLWEDHWVICAQKLQQWDILADFAKFDSLNDLYLSAAWRSIDKWSTTEYLKNMDSVVKSVSDAPTPHRMFFQSFMSLLKMHAGQESPQSFSRICDESIQLSIRKWHSLPKRITNAHIPILQNFQQLVELHDASVICASLNSTNQTNLDLKAPELKLLLSTWRDRLPNFWDDINAWQDLVTWRRHVFSLINEKYLTLVQTQANNANANSVAYRGYHETAWTINKFAHVARKHQLPEVCITQLSTIYTLPNIEIQEAFLKLREQAKCHYHNPAELQTGLDVIGNTNLNYFGSQQKAEFHTLKAMFLAKQNEVEKANEAFGTALSHELKLPKAWIEWARYNEHLFKANPSAIDKAEAAMSCYLEAAGLYKNNKSRKALARILWLLTIDNTEGVIARRYNQYEGDTPLWYWITFIPQLLISAPKPEGKIARGILVQIAKAYPQALYFHLRTSREDYQAIKKTQEMKAKAAKNQQGSPMNNPVANGSRPTTADGNSSRPGTAKIEGENEEKTDAPTISSTAEQASPSQVKAEEVKQETEQQQQPVAKHPWDYIEEISSVLKTAFPLLALSMESMVDQISRNFKSQVDEEAYRLINALYNDALASVSRFPHQYNPGFKPPQATETNISRFVEQILPQNLRPAFEADFPMSSKPDLIEYIQKLKRWRDKFEEKMDRRTPTINLESCGPHLSEFKFTKFDEVEVPGQYLLHKDKNQDFIRIERFLPGIDLTRSGGLSYRKLKIRGHDGSVHPFVIQHPAPRTSRREERMLQMFRFFNDVLMKRKESRRRKLQFTLPVMVPLTAGIRMIQDDASFTTLHTIYEDFARKKRMHKDEPTLFTVGKLRELNPKSTENVAQIRLQVFETVQAKMVPNHIVLDYFRATHPAYADFWLFRRQFAYQLAALTFMTYIMLMRDRGPTKMAFSRANGSVWGSDLVPSMGSGKAIFQNPETVPARLTPNLQIMLGPLALEGIFSASMLVIAKSLTEPSACVPSSEVDDSIPAPSTPAPDSKLEQMLTIFVRDEVQYWFTGNHRGVPTTIQLREYVTANNDMIFKRALALAKPPPGNLPANQSVIDLVSRAVNPAKLSQMDSMWMPYL